MSFFVSDNLKGRIVESDLLSNKSMPENTNMFENFTICFDDPGTKESYFFPIIFYEKINDDIKLTLEANDENISLFLEDHYVKLNSSIVYIKNNKGNTVEKKNIKFGNNYLKIQRSRTIRKSFEISIIITSSEN